MKKYGLFLLTSLFVFGCTKGAEPVKTSFNAIGEIAVHPQMVKDYFESDQYDGSDAQRISGGYVNGSKDYGFNLPINISWTSNKGEEQEYQLSFKDGEQTLVYDVVGNSFDFLNYKLNTRYEVQIAVGDYKSETTSFTTPIGYERTISVEGVSNFRDLSDAVHLKQGLIYRSMTFENNTISNIEYKEITDNGIKELRNLGIKSEIDLRKDTERGENYGKIDGINYQFMPLYYGGRNILTYTDNDFNNPNQIKRALEFMADINNYPLVFHCIRGTDRTGCLAFLIKGLLGIEEEFLKKDFIFSNFFHIGTPVKLENIERNSTTNGLYVDTLKQEEGATLQEKIYNYLLNVIGVSKTNLDSIINILKVSND